MKQKRINVPTSIAYGSAVKAILDMAQEKDVSLVAMASRGMSAQWNALSPP